MTEGVAWRACDVSLLSIVGNFLPLCMPCPLPEILLAFIVGVDVVAFANRRMDSSSTLPKALTANMFPPYRRTITPACFFFGIPLHASLPDPSLLSHRKAVPKAAALRHMRVVHLSHAARRAVAKGHRQQQGIYSSSYGLHATRKGYGR